jgi:hypothetical protein
MFKNRQSSHVCRKKHKSYSYDANGSLINDDLRHYACDSKGKLVAASLGWVSTTTTAV